MALFFQTLALTDTGGAYSADAFDLKKALAIDFEDYSFNVWRRAR
jgi:hypothetical protein